MSRRYLRGLLVTGAGVVAAGLLLPLFSRTSVRGPQTKSLSNAKQLATGCQLFANDHGGKFPTHLSELEPDYFPPGSSSDLRGEIITGGTKTEIRVDWLYFGNGFDDTNPPAILIASPQAVTSKDGQRETRVCIGGDTRGVISKEADYQKLLATTVLQMKKRHETPAPSSPPTAAPLPTPVSPNP